MARATTTAATPASPVRPGPNYVALKPMSVKTLQPDGTPVQADGKDVYRDVKRGDPVPEAIYWPNLRYYVQERYLGLAEHFVPDSPDPDGAAIAANAAAAAEGALARSRREPAPEPAAE